MASFSQLLPFLMTAPAVVYSVIAVRGAYVYFNRPRPSTAVSGLPPVTIIKPVKGADPEGYDNFASFCCQRYGDYQIIFAVASHDDAAVPVIRRLMADFPRTDIDLVIDGRVYGPNGKVCNLINAMPLAKHDIIIVCDSDIRVGERYLEEACAPFADPSIGLVTSLYRSSRAGEIAGVLEALGLSTEMIPNVMAAVNLEGLSFALGASMAVRREVLAEVGGFEPLAEYLADDYQLGNRVFRAGYRLELLHGFVESVIGEERFTTVISRQIRWGRTMRVSRPGGYFAFGMTLPGIAGMAALLTGGVKYGLPAVLFMYAVRIVAAVLFSSHYVRDNMLPKYLWLLPLRDLLSAVIWIMAFAGDRVTWRGVSYKVAPGGVMVEIK